MVHFIIILSFYCLSDLQHVHLPVSESRDRQLFIRDPVMKIASVLELAFRSICSHTPLLAVTQITPTHVLL